MIRGVIAHTFRDPLFQKRVSMATLNSQRLLLSFKRLKLKPPITLNLKIMSGFDRTDGR